jgi:hypothetical protein
VSRPTLDQPQIEAWNRLLPLIEATAQRYLRDPAAAHDDGVVIVVEHNSLNFGVPQPRPLNPYVPCLRAAAERFIPKAWTWDILETIGGQAFLVLKSYRGDTEPEAPEDFRL